MIRARYEDVKGFTLLEVIIVLAILSALLGIIAPMGYQLLTAERARAAEEELRGLYAAIVGNPETGSFGYVGDVGKYPASLLDLVIAPKDSTGAPLPGWKGPYVKNPRIENTSYLDPFGRPYEYFLKPLASGAGNMLAIIGRGADGVSTNTAPAPNVAASYVGPSPAEAPYAGDPRNADNAVFPSAGGSDGLNVVVSGTLAFNILNFDANPEVSAFVPACPQLFTVTATSLARGAVEAALSYVQGLQIDLVQGQYRVTIVPQARITVSATETLTVLPAGTLTRTLNLTGLDSSGTPPFNLTVKNGFAATDLEVFEFGDELSGSLKPGETRVYTPRACAQISIRQKGKPVLADQFVMPYGPATRLVGASAASLTVVSRVEQRLRIFRNQVLLGTVPRGDVHDDEGEVNAHVKTKTFPDLTAGDTIEVRADRDLALLRSLVLTAGNNTATIP